MAQPNRMIRLLTNILGLLVLLTLFGCADSSSATHTNVSIAGQTFHLELALTTKQRMQGLSDRDHIPADGGMLFVFPDHQVREQRFVMRQCLVPIDIIFLDPNARVVATHQMTVEPYDTPDDKLKRYSSRYPAQFAIELAGGTLDQLSVKSGDQIALPTDKLKARAQ